MRRRRLTPAEMYPAGDAVAAARTVRVATGIRMRIVEAGPDAGDPVLLLHGWGASAYMYRHLARSLAAAGRRVVAPDLRGHGLSGKPTGERGLYTREALAADVRALATALGIERFDVVGQSMGGGVALELACATPALVRRVVLINPAGLVTVRVARIARVVSPRVLDRAARWLCPRWVVRTALAACYGDRTRMTERDVDEYWAPSEDPDFVRACRALLREFGWRALPDETLRCARAPALLVAGGRDHIIPGTAGAVDRLPGARLHLVPAGGHVVHEEFPEMTDAAITAFLMAPA